MTLPIEKLRDILPAELIIVDDESLRVYECDALTAYRKLPSCVVLPENIEQVQAIMRVCHQEKLPVVARGAGTGLSGGALPVKDCVLLSLTKFDKILEIDPLQRIARVQPGVRNLSVSEAAEPYDLFYAPDPSSQIACTIGGNVAENSGGVHCLKYGLTVHNISALKVITVEGDLLEIGGQGLDAPGYDLLALMTGSEGMLGIIVEASLKLLPKPLTTQMGGPSQKSYEDYVKRTGKAPGQSTRSFFKIADMIAGIIGGGAASSAVGAAGVQSVSGRAPPSRRTRGPDADG